MKRRGLLLSLGALFALIVAGTAVIVYVADLARFRPQIESALSDALQLDITIDGELRIGWSLIPEIVVEGVSVRLPDAPATEPALAAIGRIEVEIAIAPFLRERRLEIPRVSIADVDVVVDERMRRALRPRSAAETAPPPAEPTRAGDEPPLPRVDRLQLRNAVVRLKSPDGDEKRLTIESLEARRRARLALDVDLRAEYDAMRYELELITETPEAGPRPWPFRLELDVSGLRLTLNGAFANVTRLGEGIAFDARLQGGNTGWLTRTLDLPPSDLRYDLAAHVDADGTSLAVTGLHGVLSRLAVLEQLRIAEGDVHWQYESGGRVALRGALDELPYSLTARLPALNALQAEDALAVELDLGGTTAGVQGLFEFDGEPSFSGRVEASTPVLGNLSNFADFGLPSLGPVRSAGRLFLSARRISVQDWWLSIADSEFSGAWEVLFTAPRPRADVTLRSNRLVLGDFLGGAGDPPDPDARLDPGVLQRIDAEVDFRLDSVTSLPLPLTGVAGRLALEAGRLRATGLEADVGAIPVRASVEITPGRARSLALDASVSVASLTIPAAADALAALGVDTRTATETITGGVEGIEFAVTSHGRTLHELRDAVAAIATVSGGTLSLAGDASEDFRLTIGGITLTGNPGQRLELEASGVFAGIPLMLEATGRRLADLLQTPAELTPLDAILTTHLAGRDLQLRTGVRPVDADGMLAVTASADYATLELLAETTLPALEAFPDARWLVSARSGDISPLLAPDTKSGPSLPLEASGAVSIEGNGLVVRDLGAMLGELSAEGTLSAQRRDDRLRLEGRLRSDLIDLKALQRGAGVSPARPAPGEGARPDAGPPPGRMFPDTPLPLKPVAGFEADVALRVDRLWIGNILLEGADNHLTLSPTELHYALHDDTGRAQAAFALEALGAASGDYRGRLDATLRHVRRDREWAGIPAGLAFDISEYPAINADVRLEASGDSIATLAAGTAGTATIWMDPGKLPPELAFGLLFDDILGQTLTALNPLTKQRRYYALECAALHLDIVDGIATATRGFAIQTESTNFVGGGAINLVDELIDLRIDSTPRKGLGLSLFGFADDFVRVGGTLASPKIVLDRGSALTKGVAGWATGGLSLLYGGPIKRLFARRDPCAAILTPQTDEGAIERD